MGDMKLVTSTRISKTSLILDRTPVASSLPPAPPAFTLPPRNSRVSVGSTARFDGKVRGYPEPRVTWYKNGQPVVGSERCVVEQGVRGIFSLVIKDVTEEDQGKYTCEASNDEGVRQVTVELILEVSRELLDN
ncbi:myosin light chain kinase, smooth muscle-like [Discoglossus pictus]